MATRGNLPKKTLAAVLTKLKAPLEILELDIPDLLFGQVLVRVKLAGLCRTQLSETQGLKGEDNYLPHLLGHEAVGEVVEVGQNVTTVKAKDTVVMSWIKGKGMDVPGGIFH
ncbi:MAG: alcohol dehydrogenase catalytic domain-containing protein, partial [Candidatus Andersenbacteria bacterium]|nr:alcohol dehydrogenase catalytic domain-containing protein [Candidatus Andersenbacteria bacterium]